MAKRGFKNNFREKINKRNASEVSLPSERVVAE